MARIKSVVLAEVPSWYASQQIGHLPGELELSLEGTVVHLRVIGNGPIAARIRTRMGSSHLAIGRWNLLVFEDEPAKDTPPKK